MGKLGQRLGVTAQMDPALPKSARLIAGAGASVYHNGLYYPSRVIECPRPLRPGDTGEAVIGIIGTPEYPLDFTEGSEFELRAGVTKVATAKVVKVLPDPEDSSHQ